ncbi:TRAP-type mannitol/chloroaromatic compound transport system permease small subunit [Bradyrhizobium sp. GM24.11]
MQALLKLSRGIDAFTRWTGKRLAWLILVAVIISAVNAIVRKAFDVSSNSWLELQWVLFSIVFLLCSPWTLLDNEHIRIDIFNNMMPKKARNIIDVVGHAFFLLPLTIVMMITGVPFFQRSFDVNEQSGNAGGLPQWPAKSLIMIAFAFLFVQGISELIKRIGGDARADSRSSRVAGEGDRSRGRAPRPGDRKEVTGGVLQGDL